MDNARTTAALRGDVIDDALTLTTTQLCRACNASEAHIELWVSEGVLQPSGNSPDDWRFSSHSLTRVRIAMRLTRDLEVNAPGVALALQLLDEISSLEAHLRRGSSPAARRLRP